MGEVAYDADGGAASIGLHPQRPTVMEAPRPTRRPVIVRAHEGTAYPTHAETITFKVVGDHSGDAITIAHGTVAPGGGPPPHVHTREDEVFIVTEGHLRVFADGVWHDASAGDVAFLPRGVVHTFQGAGPGPARFYVVATPSGFERFYAEFAPAVTAEGGPAPAVVDAICRRHGILLGMPEPTPAA